MPVSPYKNILVVCQGNICRSPVAEAMLRRQFPDKQVQSAGITAMSGHDADAVAAELASADGLDLSAHQARQLTQEHLQWADLVLVMSHNQRAQIGQKEPGAMGKTLLLGHWLKTVGGAGQGQDIPDPYKKSRDVFEHVHRLMAQAVAAWASKL
jgi:protein-tyrosine phosphatase